MSRQGFSTRMALFRLLLVAVLSGCQATQYQSAAPRDGFGEVELEGNIWRIRFMHNAFTTRETAQSYWLYRAAELTMSKGYDGFEVLSQSSRARSSGDMLSRSSAFFIEGEIRMLKKPFESVPPRTYNAEALRTVLDPYVMGAKGEPTVAMRIEMPPSDKDGIRLRMMYAIPSDPPARSTQPAAAPAERPKPAPIVLRRAPSIVEVEPPLKPTGPCEVKPVMTDQDLINCGARLR